MAIWLYTGTSLSGKAIEGEIQAPSKEDAKNLLRKKRILVGKIRKKPLELKLNFSKGVSIKDLARFTRQFAAMNSAGLPLIQCLDTLRDQVENENLRLALQKATSDIQGGSTLSDALAKHPKIFSELYCHMISAGEAGGILENILMRLADYLEKAEKLLRKIRGAMMYPFFVVIVAIVVVMILLTKVVPTFAAMFQSTGGTLPLPTQMILDASNFIQSNFIFIIIVMFSIPFGLYRYYKTPAGKFAMDKFSLRLPVFGDLIRKSATARFTRTLSTLLNAGVPIIDSLRITSRTAGNKVLELGIKKSLESISGGQTIAEPLAATKIFPAMVIQMVAVGEKTGGLADMLSKVSDFYEDEVDAAVDNLTSLIEPLIIVLLGGVIGAILIAMYLPMFDMATNIG